MTTITIERELLEQALVALSAPNHCVFSEPQICVDIRAALATEDDMDILRHMLGVCTHNKRSTWGYRNHFAAGAGSIASMERLVVSGYVTRGRTTDSMTYYHATEAGMDAIGLSKAAKRRAMEP